MARKKQAEREAQKPNFRNRTMVVDDNLYVLEKMNEACIDLVYLDPPFNSNKRYSAPAGSEAAGASFEDMWTLDKVDVRWLGKIAERDPALFKVIDAAGAAGGKGMKAYLLFMAMRFIEIKRVLKDTGSVFLHVDPTASHYLKMMMDCVFGRRNFINEIIWSYNDSPGGRTAKWFPKKHDVILSYAVDKGKHTFNKDAVKVPIKDASAKRYESERSIGGRTYLGGDTSGKTPEDVWPIPVVKQNKASREGVGYPTQKPLRLLERIVAAASNHNDWVLDPFAGCATACIAAEKLGRKWIGIDVSDIAVRLVESRMGAELQDVLKLNTGGRVPKVHRKDDRADKANEAKRKPYQKRYNHPDNKRELFGLQEGECAVCHETLAYRSCEIDHIVPRAKGGGDEMENLQILCAPCNRDKRDRDYGDFKKLKAAEREELIAEENARHEERMARLKAPAGTTVKRRRRRN